jgi:calcium-dependent protein kinase
MGNWKSKTDKFDSVHPTTAGVLNDGSEAVASARFSPQRLTQTVVKETYDHDIEEYYDIDDQTVLGTGSNGSILMCIHKNTKMLYALKSFSKADITESKLAQIRNELSSMAQLDHPNILRIHEVFENVNSIYLVNELCKGGDMLERLKRQPRGAFNERTACRHIHAILSATAYCHANNIVHCDLKLENIVFETQDKDSDIKIIGKRGTATSAPCSSRDYSTSLLLCAQILG